MTKTRNKKGLVINDNMTRKKAEAPKLNIINPDTIQDQVKSCVNEYCNLYGINIYDYSQRSNIKHNEVNNILLYCYDNLFKPSKGLMNNQKSLIDYDDIEQLQAVINSFIHTCLFFNKALGLMSFSLFSGIDDNTLIRWCSPDGEKANPRRWELLKTIKEHNKNALISNLKDSPVGALAVANNDIETGLQWSQNQLQQLQNNTVFLIPSERVDRLKLDSPKE